MSDHTETVWPATLFDALRVLAECHTMDDEQIGFTIHTRVAPWKYAPHSFENYTKAWAIVREQMHMPTRLKAACGSDENG